MEEGHTVRDFMSPAQNTFQIPQTPPSDFDHACSTQKMEFPIQKKVQLYLKVACFFSRLSQLFVVKSPTGDKND